jgi:genome maintenance exonuclease 1
MSYTYLDYPTHSIEGKRVYQIDEERFYPSITTILGQTQPPEKNNILDNWRKRVGNKEADRISNSAMTRGTNTHLMLERYLGGQDPKLHEFPPEHVKIFTSLRLELTKINKTVGQEVVLFSDVLGVAGRCDLVAEYQGELAIIDYKTSSRVKTKDEIGDYWLQAAFYTTAHNEMFGTNITKMIIMMGVENKMALVFRKKLDDELLLELATRVSNFYAKL